MTHYDGDLLEEKASEFLEHLLSETTKLPLARVDASASFESFGLDSVMAMAMTARMEAVFGSLPTTLFFEFGTPRELARHLVATRRSDVSRLLGEAATDPVVPAAGSPAARGGVRPTGPLRRKPLASTRWSAQQTEVPSPSAPRPAAARPARQGLDIAIIGLAGRYPKARTVDEFWANLAAGRDCVTTIPADRWDHEAYFDPDPDAPGKTYSRWGGFIDGVDEFDPLFFNISPVEAERMDPQERLFLQMRPRRPSRTPDTPGPAEGSDGLRPHRPPSASTSASCTAIPAVRSPGAGARQPGGRVRRTSRPIANRVSYYFDFHGPEHGVDTMCSSSLTAIHLACQSIRSGELRPGGRRRRQRLGASEQIPAAGPEPVRLQRRAVRELRRGRRRLRPGRGRRRASCSSRCAASADGDHIHGVIRGSAVNHGGKTNGYTVPNPAAQARVITDAWQQGGIDRDAVSYIEAHGTGTALGRSRSRSPDSPGPSASTCARAGPARSDRSSQQHRPRRERRRHRRAHQGAAPDAARPDRPVAALHAHSTRTSTSTARPSRSSRLSPTGRGRSSPSTAGSASFRGPPASPPSGRGEPTRTWS